MSPSLFCFGIFVLYLMLRKPSGTSARRRSYFALADWLSLRNVSYISMQAAVVWLPPHECTLAYSSSVFICVFMRRNVSTLAVV